MTAVETLAEAVRSGDRRALARAVTLVESTRADHRAEAERLVEMLLPAAGGAIRLGVTGAPGVGKSTFIERFGLDGIARGRRVAVLAVDPVSKRGGGAILGDKTRMAELARARDAFIRPSPGGDGAGGVARRTRETILLCEAAGFDAVIVETIGVGQSETAVAAMVDMFVLLLSPAGGDELQGIKRGIIELADLVLVTKADDGLRDAARRTAADYANAMRLLRPRLANWQVPVRAISSINGTGVAETWDDAERFRATLEAAGEWQRRRADQARAALWAEIGASLLDGFRGCPAIERTIGALEADVAAGRRTPTSAARRLLSHFLSNRSG